jgi:hypothetical protein
VATVEQCRQALGDIATKLSGDPATAARLNLDRSLVCHIRDLNMSFHGRLRNGTLEDMTEGEDPNAQIRLSIGSDDLVALVAGQLNFATAWASGRASVKASFTDLLKLRKLL